MIDREKQTEQENFHIFLYKVMADFNKVNRDILHHTGKRLELPRFVINRKKWGMFSPSDRKLFICEDLIRNFEWGAVVHVLKHEMAHMVVHEILNMGDCRAHGEAFSKACKIVGCDDRRCCSSTFLDGFKGKDHESPLIDKVRKLMAKGQCESATEAEADAFLKKAQSMMLTHNITNIEVMGTEKCFVSRPVGGKHKRYPSWLWAIGHIVTEHYNVEAINTYTYNSKTGERFRYLELFGEAHNVDVAEYVFHVLFHQANKLYENFKKNGKKSWRKKSKVAYIRGLMSGYADRLGPADEEDEATEEQSALLLASDRLLKEKYKQAYPSMTTGRSAGSKGDGYGQGLSDSGKLSVRTGVKGSGSKTLQLGG